MDRTSVEGIYRRDGVLLTQTLRRLAANCDSLWWPRLQSGIVPENLRRYKEFGDMLVAPRRRFLLPDVEKIAPGFTAAAQGVLVGANAILAGMPGGGKTCAACALAVELTILGKTVDWVCWEELLGLMSAAAGFGEAARETVQGLTRCDSLVIDDFGRSAITTDNKFAGLRELIDARYRAGRQTLITSNIPQSELMRNVGEHLIGRVYENAVVLRFASTSLRMPKCVATL